jgi:hypothetical protein
MYRDPSWCVQNPKDGSILCTRRVGSHLSSVALTSSLSRLSPSLSLSRPRREPLPGRVGQGGSRRTQVAAAATHCRGAPHTPDFFSPDFSLSPPIRPPARPLALFYESRLFYRLFSLSCCLLFFLSNQLCLILSALVLSPSQHRSQVVSGQVQGSGQSPTGRKIISAPLGGKGMAYSSPSPPSRSLAVPRDTSPC